MEGFKDEREMKVELCCPTCMGPQSGINELKEGILVSCRYCGALLVLIRNEENDQWEFLVTSIEL